MKFLRYLSGVYHFRRKVPKELRPFFSSSELSISLKTSDLKKAESLARIYSSKLEEILQMVQSGFCSEEVINNAVRDYFRCYYKVQWEDLKNPTVALAKNENSLKDTLDLAIEVIGAGKNFLLDRKLSSHVSTHIGTILTSIPGMEIDNENFPTINTNLPPDSEQLLFFEIAQQLIKINTWIKNQLSGTPSQSDNDYIDYIMSESPTLNDTVKDFITSKKIDDAWSPNTEKEVLSMLQVMTELLDGNIPIKNISRDMMKRLSHKIKKLPPNWKKKSQFKDKTISEVLDMDYDTTISSRTFNKYITQISSFFKWAYQEGKINNNPSHKLISSTAKSLASSSRRVYSPEELKKLFSIILSKEKILRRHQNQELRPERFWIPFLGLYTGMRLEELCQLNASDLKHQDGIYYFDLTDPDRKLKTLQSYRVVPIHKDLIDLGLLKYVDTIQKENLPTLWKYLQQRTQGKLGHAFSKWFNPMIDHNLTDDKRVTFHSFRHTFTDHLKQKGSQEQLIGELVGHKSGSITMERYGKKYELENLYKAVSVIKYGLPLKKLIIVADRFLDVEKY